MQFYKAAVPKDHTAEWPDRCVRCGATKPDTHLELAPTEPTKKDRAPICRGCLGSEGRRKYWWFATRFGAAAVACALVGWAARAYAMSGWQFYLVVALCAPIVLVPRLLFGRAKPQAVFVWSGLKRNHYVFADEAYCRDFARKNGVEPERC